MLTGITLFEDAILRPPSSPREMAISFPTQIRREQFVVRQLPSIVEPPVVGRTNYKSEATPEEQHVRYADAVVRLPSLRESKWKVTVLQRWIGRVERTIDEKFVAVLADATYPQNPPEQV